MRTYKNNFNFFGKIIENARLTHNISREDLAKKLQLYGIIVDRSYIYRIEKQKSIIKDFELLAIANILDIDLNMYVKDEFQ